MTIAAAWGAGGISTAPLACKARAAAPLCLSFSHQVFGSAAPISWEQLEKAARYRHRSGAPMSDHVKAYVFERLTARRPEVQVGQAFGCMQELKKSFTLRAGPGEGSNSSCAVVDSLAAWAAD